MNRFGVSLFSLFLALTAGLAAQNVPVGTPSEKSSEAASVSVPAPAQPGADSLKGYMESLQKAIASHNVDQTRGLARPLLADWARLKLALRDDADPKILEQIQKMMPDPAKIPDADFSKMFKIDAEQTQVNIHAATTEEIAQNQPKSVVAAEFPGGAVQVAKTLLKPGMTFYEVEFVRPGQPMGIKYHLVFWDGHQWTIAGALWRALKK